MGKIISLSFDPNRDDKFDVMLLETAHNIKRQQPRRDFREIMEEILSTIDIWQGGAHSGVRVNKDEFLSAAMARKSIARVIGTTADLTKLTREQILALARGTVTASRIETVSHVPKGKTKINQKKPVTVSAKNMDAKVIQQARERITGVAENMDLLLVISGCDNVIDAISHIDVHEIMQEEVLEEFGLEWSLVKLLFAGGVITPMMIEIMPDKNQDLTP